MKKNILISIHDVMPSNLSKINNIIYDLKKNYNITQLTLLVVPGLKWEKDQIAELKSLRSQGHELAGHGWIHKTSNIKTIYHKVHSKLISRDVAEHLSISKKEIINLLNNCFDWFKNENLPQPTLYVPPSWAIGKLKTKDFNKTKFQMFETLSGIYFKNKFHKLPLLGYEADTLFRKFMVKISNKINNATASIFKIPIRLSIHPNDFELLISKDLIKDLKSNATFWSYESYFNLNKN
tara:strand:+ start:2126 stop:2836 length:711 start_codon:yes stop_codon:yes gene_type:complete